MVRWLKFSYDTHPNTFVHSFEFLPALVGLGLTIELAMLFSALVTSVACWEGAGWIWM